MIVCSCRAVCDQSIRRALQSGEPGACSLAGVQRNCNGAGTDCGACIPTIRKMVRQEANSAAQDAAAAAAAQPQRVIAA